MRTDNRLKWIANEIRVNEGKKKYIGGGEESFGFLPFDKVRDKDSPASICLICEIAAWARDNGMTLYDLLMNIYAEYGFSRKSPSMVRPGKTGADEIKQMMTDFRENPPKASRRFRRFVSGRTSSRWRPRRRTATVDEDSTCPISRMCCSGSAMMVRRFLSVLPAQNRRSSSIWR